MFTGLVQKVGVVEAISPGPTSTRIDVDAGGWSHRPEAGASISVSGCCLTVAEAGADGRLVFDVVPETLSRTTLGSLATGSRVNLEHSVTPSTLLGGHLVQGHIDGVACVASVSKQDEWRVSLEPPAELMQFVSPKGSVTIDGVSLTVADLDPGEGWFEVVLIPTTLEETTLAGLEPGALANFEADMLVKALVHWVRHHGSGSGPPA